MLVKSNFAKTQLYPEKFRMRMKYSFVISSFLLIFISQVAFGQQYFIKSYAAENGLPTRLISDACQDKDGYMWFSTYLGISKYDGFSFTNYDSVNGLPNQHYRKIKCDQKGILWAVPASSFGNIIYFKDNVWKTISPPNSADRGAYITSFEIVYIGNNPVICIGSYNGVDVFRDQAWKHYDVSDDKSRNVVFDVTAKNDLFYLSTRAGICVLDGETLNWSLSEKINKTHDATLAIKFENAGLPDEKMWVLTYHSIGYYSHNKFKQVVGDFFLEDFNLASFPFLEIGKNGKIIFGNAFSKYLLKTATSQLIPLKKKNGFSTNGASSVFIDREDNMWFMDNRGIDKISNINLVNYFESGGLPENEVSSIVETNDGRYVLGHNNRISILKDNTFKVIEIPGVQNSLTRVLDLMKDRDGNIWFSANTFGIGKLTKDDKLRWYKSFDGFMATSIQQDNSGRIWIGSNKKLYYLKGEKIVEYEHNALFPKIGIRKIYKCDKGGIYVSSFDGFWHISTDAVTKIKSEDESQALNSFAYYKDKKGTEFVGTMNGLYYINNGVITRFRNKKLNITNPIFFILQDNENFYWFGTNNGVYRWDGIHDPEVFNTYNGLAGNETNRSAGILDSKGKVWVGTDKGLTCFDRGNNRLSTPVPAVQLLYTETIRGDRFPLNKSCSVSNTDNTLSFHFRGISFVNEELLTYRYKLEGFDDESREATQNMLDKIKYVNLKPGKYRLLVMAKNYSSDWSPLVYSKEIVIKPPFYLTWWFQLILILILVILLVIFYSIASQRIINKALKEEISQRILAEDKRKESEQRLSFVIEGSHLGTWDWDISKNKVQRNQLCRDMLGYSSMEMEATDFWLDLIHPDDKERSFSALQKHLEGESQLLSVEYRIRAKNNHYKWILDRAMVVQRDAAGKPLRMSGTLTDITERKEAEEALQKSEDRLRLLMASLPVAIFIAPVDPAIDLSMITGNVKVLTGFTEEDFLSEPDFWSKRLHPEDHDRVRQAYKDAPLQGGLSIEYRWKMADGTYKWIQDQSIIKTEGTEQQFLGVFVDINDLKVAEQVIKDKNEQLSILNAEKDKLFSIISHDLRSPVSGFLGLTELLTDEIDQISAAQLREILLAMHTSAGKVNDLLNDLLEWSQLQRGLTTLTPSVLNLKQIVDDCLKLTADQAGLKNIEMRNEVPGEMEITADIHMLQVVLRNLLSNAVKFTPKAGNVSIAAAIENNQFVRISIKDTGIGMSPDLLSKLFKVNEKTGRKGTEGEPSSGLGLILCSEFVEKQNGKIWAESNPNSVEEGKGSTFYFTVPFKKA